MRTIRVEPAEHGAVLAVGHGDGRHGSKAIGPTGQQDQAAAQCYNRHNVHFLKLGGVYTKLFFLQRLQHFGLRISGNQASLIITETKRLELFFFLSLSLSRCIPIRDGAAANVAHRGSVEAYNPQSFGIKCDCWCSSTFATAAANESQSAAN